MKEDILESVALDIPRNSSDNTELTNIVACINTILKNRKIHNNNNTSMLKRLSIIEVAMKFTKIIKITIEINIL